MGKTSRARLRAPVQKKRPRGVSGNGERTERTVRVRSRLVAGVAVVGVTVLAAGAPAIFHASSELSESQSLVTLAELNRQAVTLAHSLSDERDDVTAYIAAGREEADADQGDPDQGDEGSGAGAGAESGANKSAKALSSSRSARVDRQLDEIEAAAPASLRRDLARIPGIRRDALTGEGTALEAHKAYTEAIQKLQDLAEELADRTPPRAAEATRAPSALGQAVEQAAATRGLLIAALSVPRENTGSRVDPITGLLVPIQESKTSESARTRNALSAAAQQSRVRELAALADFDQAAGPKSRQSLKTTVTGSEVRTAEQYLARLTDQPQLSNSELGTDRRKAEAALSARIDLMRGVESSLGSAQVQRLELLRDDDVTALEIRIALAGLLMIIAVGVSTAVARTLTQPLAVLRLGAARLAAEPEPASAEAGEAAGPEAVEPIRFTGRNDEFAQVVRSLNTLHARLAETGARAEKLAADRTHLIGQRESLAADRTALQGQAAEAAAQLERLRHTVHSTFVNLSLRTLGVVERQLGVIEGLEEREQDPERLSTLFKLDHMATVMRRHGENLLVLAGTEQGPGHAGPVPLVDVLRAAVSEIERYERVAIQSLPPHSHVAGFAANDLSHLLAELLENATSFSPPDSKVQFSGWLLENGEVMLSVQDEGIGMPEARIAELNARLTEPTSYEPGEGTDGGIGLHVAALLAARHGVQVRLREQKQGGVAAVVVLPGALLPTAPSVAAPPSVTVAGDAPALNLPGSVAEANSNALPGRSATPGTPAAPEAVDEDPLVTAAERTLREVAAVRLAEEGSVTDSAPVRQGSDTTDAPKSSEIDPGPEPVHENTDLELDARTRGERAAAAAFDPYAIGPDTHERVRDGNVPQDEPLADEGPADDPLADEPLIDEPTWTMRLPKVPTEAAEAAEPAVPTVIESTPAEPHSAGFEAEVPSSASASASASVQESATDTDAGADASAPTPWERVTDKGLPKRTPKVLQSGAAEPAARTGSVDADALRRRLGGFQQGANEGRRDVEAEISSSSTNGDRTETEGDTVEEARS
ncbi:nitrate- and nitrite sensing domain-containing protein [Streptomyces sp. H27-C3]|uniref:sensor histidine kinase n=1 Tax=Streptomyces sp. H27-C3 TaxID=3046305 RepID=UPI0024BAB6AD|nr:nitrate- and nitrite sensing domain-containing protein [Streptomyces sp. H27-C3]MDJ0462225.1 nitrate- and nitrite sensing domain-containing protein [Streptomyces sp. H27-C3]